MNPKKGIITLYLFNFIKSLQFFGAIAVPFYLHRVGLTFAQMFSLEAVFSISMLILEIPTGVIADRFGRKVSLFLGSVLFGGAFLIFGVSLRFTTLLVAEVICAIGMTLQSGADRALVYELSGKIDGGKNVARINARYDAFGTAGLLIAFPAGSLFAQSGILPYKTALCAVFFASGIAILLAGFLVVTIREPDRRKFHGSALRAGIDGFRFIFTKPALTRFSLNYAIVSSLTFFMFWFYQALLVRHAFPIGLIGFVGAGTNLAAMAILLATGFVQKTVGTRRALLLSSVIPGFLYIGVFLLPGLPMALVAIFGVIMLKLFRAPLLTALMNDHIEDENRATVLSGVSMLERFMTTVLYPLAGILTDISLGWTFLAMGTITILASVLLRVDETHLGEAITTS
jgi:MFS family permease